MTKKMYSVRVAATLTQKKQIYKFVINNSRLSQCEKAININKCIMYWDDYKQDIIYLSKAFPECLFILDIASFEFFDFERLYFQNGRVQKPGFSIEYSDPNDFDWED